jgi:hypothetical protein
VNTPYLNSRPHDCGNEKGYCSLEMTFRRLQRAGENLSYRPTEQERLLRSHLREEEWRYLTDERIPEQLHGPGRHLESF